jgi:hypothetical protein
MGFGNVAGALKESFDFLPGLLPRMAGGNVAGTRASPYHYARAELPATVQRGIQVYGDSI